jgi:dienelactone hydrolase
MATEVRVSESIVSSGNKVDLDVYVPATAGPSPAVLVLHGSFGLLDEYKKDLVSFPDALKAAGIASVMPRYLMSTGTEPGAGVLKLIEAKPEIRRPWRQACADTLAWMAADARFDKSRLGILGFSLGGNLALGVAMDPPAGVVVKCVVEFFGPVAYLEDKLSAMPPLMIFHGGADFLVSPSQSHTLVTALQAAGKKQDRDFFVDFKSYEKESHGFKGEKLTSSRTETVDFFKKYL